MVPCIKMVNIQLLFVISVIFHTGKKLGERKFLSATQSVEKCDAYPSSALIQRDVKLIVLVSGQMYSPDDIL